MDRAPQRQLNKTQSAPPSPGTRLLPLAGPPARRPLTSSAIGRRGALVPPTRGGGRAGSRQGRTAVLPGGAGKRHRTTAPRRHCGGAAPLSHWLPGGGCGGGRLGAGKLRFSPGRAMTSSRPRMEPQEGRGCACGAATGHGGTRAAHAHWRARGRGTRTSGGREEGVALLRAVGLGWGLPLARSGVPAHPSRLPCWAWALLVCGRPPPRPGPAGCSQPGSVGRASPRSG